jgi:hypothetical protein
LWDLESGQLIREFRRDENAPGSLVFSPDGRWLVSAATGDTPLQLWNVADGSLIRQLGQQDIGRSWYASSPVAFSPQGKLLAAATRAGEIVLWELATGQPLERFRGHAKEITSLAFSPDGRRLLSASEDTTMLLWQLAGSAAAGTSGGHLGSPYLDAEQLARLWSELASADAVVAHRAMQQLAVAPAQAVELFRARLKPGPPLDRDQLPGLIDRLRSGDVTERFAAARRLKQFGRQAAPALLVALHAESSAAARRELEAVLAAVGQYPVAAGELRRARSLRMLEQLEIPEARRLLDSLANSPDSTPLRRAARQAMERLERRQRAPATRVNSAPAVPFPEGR